MAAPAAPIRNRSTKASLWIALLACAVALLSYDNFRLRSALSLSSRIVARKGPASALPVPGLSVEKGSRAASFAIGENSPDTTLSEPTDAAETTDERVDALRNSPEFRRIRTFRQKLLIEQTHAALFKKLSLSPDRRELIKDLLLERQNGTAEVLASAKAQGLDSRNPAHRPKIDPLVRQFREGVDANLRQALGDEGFAELKHHDATLPQRHSVNELAQRTSAIGAPLQEEQFELLVQVLAENKALSPTGKGTAVHQFIVQNRGRDGVALIAPFSDGALKKAQPLLTPGQFAAFEQLHQEHQMELRMIELKRSAPGR